MIIIEKIIIKIKCINSYFDKEHYTKNILNKFEGIRLRKSILHKNRAILKKFGFTYETGFPDFFYIENSVIKFVECKGMDGITCSQLIWILKYFSECDIRIIFVKDLYAKKLKESGHIISWEKNGEAQRLEKHD